MTKILLLEDDEDLREVLALILVSAGYQVVETSDIRSVEGLDIKTAQIDLILSDTNLPDGNSLYYWKGIAMSTPIIVMSGKEENQELAKSLVGFKGFLHKPFKPDQLLILINNALSSGESAK